MRMIGLALLTFLIAGISLALSQVDVAGRASAALAQASSRAIVFATDTAQPESAASEYPFAYLDLDVPLILSGFGAYQSARFDLPHDSRVSGGTLIVDTNVQASSGALGVLRVSVAGTKRAELRLLPGIVARSLAIPLTAEELLSDHLDVAFSMQGEGETGPCTSDNQIAAVATIEPTTHLNLALDAAPVSERDRVAAWGGVARIGWHEGVDAGSRTERLLLAAGLIAKGQGISFEVDTQRAAFDTGDLIRLSARHERPLQTVWPVEPALKAPNSGLRKFTRETVWRQRFGSAAHDAETATYLDYEIYLGPVLNNTNWVVSVTLNGRALEVRTVPGGQRTITNRLALPLGIQTENNLVEITARSDAAQENRCSDGPELMAELTPKTRITGGGAPLSNPVATLAGLLDGHPVTLTSAVMHNLTGIEASSAAHLLATILPAQTPATAQDGAAEIRLLSRGETFVNEPARDHWVVGYDPDGLIIAVPQGDGKTIISATRLLITLPDRRVSANEAVR